MRPAKLFEPLEEKMVKCLACNHYCRIAPGKQGRCRVRENQNGFLVSLVYDRLVSAGSDPIEKKPIFHLKPGSTSFSIATMGCNFRCQFCQNSDIAQMPQGLTPEAWIMGKKIEPEDIVAQAMARGCESISYTYTEPTVFFELALGTARLAKEKGLYNIFVTNGFMSPELIDLAAPVLDAANVDLKAFNEDFYKQYCRARLGPVKESLKLMKQKGMMVEVTTLIIPGLNDDPNELEKMAGFISRELGPETPWHLSRFHPAYRLQDRAATPVKILEQACDIGVSAGLYHVYTGNVPGARENTFCRACNALVVRRQGYGVENYLVQGCCPECGHPVYGIY
ncbi:MAG: AmmeMemoRadiSam system radical SAM enzyme [Desulfobacter sp.]|nr:AmmeMemoRadiSam system radical SAM enzyme [Desulfobacter sp.]WDP83792.1 MAG: AmmeMemoRadiSam system radical SAM enzyme [Desulfobacter sp.]